MRYEPQAINFHLWERLTENFSGEGKFSKGNAYVD
jgi:hypothetical protein